MLKTILNKKDTRVKAFLIARLLTYIYIKIFIQIIMGLIMCNDFITFKSFLLNRMKRQALFFLFYIASALRGAKKAPNNKSLHHFPKSISPGQICVCEWARKKKHRWHESSVRISHTIYPIFNRVRAGKWIRKQCSRHADRKKEDWRTHVNVIRLEDNFSDLPGRRGGWIISVLSAAAPPSATLLTVWNMGFCGSVCGR